MEPAPSHSVIVFFVAVDVIFASIIVLWNGSIDVDSNIKREQLRSAQRALAIAPLVAFNVHHKTTRTEDVSALLDHHCELVVRW